MSLIDLHLDRLVDLALEEDLGCAGDVTTSACVPPSRKARGVLKAKERLVVAGLVVFARVLKRVDPDLRLTTHAQDGDEVEPQEVVATIEGNARSLLMAERTALNFVMRLSGIATQARALARLLGKSSTRLIDTRKTTPGWRKLEKDAVRVGGAHNHRFGLSDGVLIKDNHIEAAGGITAAVGGARASAHHLVGIEVECATLDDVDECLRLGVEAVLLDNMDDTMLAAAVRRIREAERPTGASMPRRVFIEASGNMTPERLPRVAALGVDAVSMGALTHQARSVDLSLKIELLPS